MWRLLSLAYRLPSGPNARWVGWLNVPCAVPVAPPVAPSACSLVPPGENSTRRFEAVSATQTLPLGATAMPCGLCNPPKLVMTFTVDASSFTTELPLLSATYTTPPATVTSRGLCRALVLHCTVRPVPSMRSTRLLKVSATTTSEPTDAIPNGQCRELESLPR